MLISQTKKRKGGDRMAAKAFEEAVHRLENPLVHRGTSEQPPTVRICANKDENKRQIVNMSDPQDLAALSSLCEKAPCGRGTEDVHDPKIRSCHQTDSSRVEVYFEGLQGVLDQVREKLTPFSSLSAEFYKLLVYHKTDFFKPHRNSRKADGHIFTLAVDCGSDCSGRALKFLGTHLLNTRSQNGSKRDGDSDADSLGEEQSVSEGEGGMVLSEEAGPISEEEEELIGGGAAAVSPEVEAVLAAALAVAKQATAEYANLPEP
uniref:Uncharacterized protein n=1 Tax=Chromera velia CCMP2878 TaxID=1169474 RepID=A0A0G4GVD1_9ALVE|eukprot:Cvel_23529.t1-p1 / transcript=Cvel_23529.t1 / gene=Cvel_23529 / organism=Chromera_velia_CCMP2878 / gene_product=hypothetical protein / transcript_product=hypothetical protein / location=Cvel_scaffold2435:11685-12467(+) / protein_length=261 / sequence_SO=supercontig / SO=protein_coding / is_pseudo=false